jgi:hypothetical protein
MFVSLVIILLSIGYGHIQPAVSQEFIDLFNVSPGSPVPNPSKTYSEEVNKYFVDFQKALLAIYNARQHVSPEENEKLLPVQHYLQRRVDQFQRCYKFVFGLIKSRRLFFKCEDAGYDLYLDEVNERLPKINSMIEQVELLQRNPNFKPRSVLIGIVSFLRLRQHILQHLKDKMEKELAQEPDWGDGPRKEGLLARIKKYLKLKFRPKDWMNNEPLGAIVM